MSENPLITVGIPVFNGEKFLKKRFDSILNQTYKNLEIIISDNASTDNTSALCEEFLRKEKNTQYYRQKKNLGFVSNFNFIIEQSSGKYFVFAAVDDLWEPEFLEKNIQVLEQNSNIVGSISEIDYFGSSQKQTQSKFTLVLKKIVRRQDVNVLEKHVRPVSGKFKNKVDKYLRFNQGSFVYGLYRTKEIKKNIIPSPLAAWDGAFILNILKFGDLHVINEILFHKYSGGLSSKGIIETYRRKEIPFSDILIPNFSFLRWACKNIGLGFCLRNIDWFILITIYGWHLRIKEIKDIL